MEINILNFGAVGDGVTMNTQAIQSAIAEASAHGGGRVVVPAGTFRTGTIYLEDHIELHLEPGAVLKASEDFADYNAPDAYPQNFGSERELWTGQHLILALEKTGVAITGLGTINGSGPVFFEEKHRCKTHNYCWVDGFAKAKDPVAMRPGQMIVFVECRDVTLRDVTLEDSPCWTALFHGCSYVSVSGVRIRNSIWHANTDGLDFDTCRFVTVTNCIIDTGDDALTVRCNPTKLLHAQPISEHILVSNCILATSASAVRIGVGLGEIHNVNISNITIPRASTAFHLMTSYKARGSVSISDVSFSNVIAENVAFPLQLMQEKDSYIRGAVFSNCRIKAFCAAKLHAETPGMISDITVKDFDVTQVEERYFEYLDERAEKERGDAAIMVEGVSGLTLENLRLHIPEALSSRWPQSAHFIDCKGLVKRNCEI